MKKLLTGILAAAMTMGLFTGCGGGGAASSAAPSPSAASPASSVNEPSAPEPPKADFPKKNIDLIVPQNAGGDTDLIARTLASLVEKDLGVSIVINNVPGGSTSIGLQQLKESEADGYTILCNATNISLIKPSGIADIDSTDFQPICGVNKESCYVVVRADDERFGTFEDLVAYAKANPGKLNLGTGQAGGVWYLAAVALGLQCGIENNIIPNPGGIAGVGLTLLNGDVDLAVISLGSNAASVEAGEMKLLACFSEERTEAYPDVPTIKELGHDLVINSNRGFLAPKGTPAEVVDILEQSFLKAADSQEYRDFMDSIHSGIMRLSAVEYGELMSSEDALYAELIEAANLG